MSEQQVNIEFNPDNWTLGDMEVFEDIVGLTLQEALTPAEVLDSKGHVQKDKRGRPVKARRITPKMAVAIVYIEKHAEDATFTVDDARRVKFKELVLDDSDDDPKDVPSASEGSKS